jgi:NAD(P)-dependent dehydrogenase (short-subunit alcohol dehydrogenase family)
VLFDLSADALAETAALCPGAVTVPGDITQAADVQRAAQVAQDSFGGVDLVVAAAGIIGPSCSAIDVEEEDWDRLFAINVKGCWLTAKSFIPQMRTKGAGSMVLFSSTAGMIGSPFLPAYSASKGAVVQLMRSLAIAHAPEAIRVNCVCPGTIESPMHRSNVDRFEGEAREALMKRLLAVHPMGRFGTPNEVAEATLYLLSDAASFTTGVALPVDGGRLA